MKKTIKFLLLCMLMLTACAPGSAGGNNGNNDNSGQPAGPSIFSPGASMSEFVPKTDSIDDKNRQYGLFEDSGNVNGYLAADYVPDVLKACNAAYRWWSAVGANKNGSGKNAPWIYLFCYKATNPADTTLVNTYPGQWKLTQGAEDEFEMTFALDQHASEDQAHRAATDPNKTVAANWLAESKRSQWDKACKGDWEHYCEKNGGKLTLRFRGTGQIWDASTSAWVKLNGTKFVQVQPFEKDWTDAYRIRIQGSAEFWTGGFRPDTMPGPEDVITVEEIHP